MSSDRLRLFAYGSLRRGGAHHDAYCSGHLGVRPAWAAGRLGRLPFGSGGHPVLHLPMLAEPATAGDEAAAGVVGELFLLPGGAATLAALDELEGFAPPGPSLYDRVRLPVWPLGASAPVAAWAYVAAGTLRALAGREDLSDLPALAALAPPRAAPQGVG